MKAAGIIITYAMVLVPVCIAQDAGRVSPDRASVATSETRSVLLQATQFRLGRLTFTGNTHTRVSLLMWMIQLSSGDIFDQSKWELGLDQINRLGLFEPVTPRDAAFSFDYVKGTVDVELKLKERDRQRIDVSAGGGTTGGINIGLDYSNINLSGIADRLTARVRVGNRERSLGAGYSITLLRKTPITLDMSGFYRRIEFVDARAARDRQPLFVERTSGAGFGLSFPIVSSYRIGSPTRLSFLYSFASTNLADTLVRQSSGAGQTLEQSGIRMASFTPALLHNTLDREFDPHSGRQLSVATEFSARLLGGSMNTIKPLVDYRAFIALGPTDRQSAGANREPRVIGIRVRASHIAGAGKPFRPEALSSVGGVPIFKRFFLGGESEVRGYDVNSIAPLAQIDRLVVASTGETTLLSREVRPIGGDTQALLNAEYRVPLVWRSSAAAFVDFGASLNLRRLREERFESAARIEPLGTPATIVTLLRPLDGGLPSYRISVGAELRFQIPVLNVPLRLIFSANPNAQRRFPEGALLAPEKKFAFGFGFGRTL